MKRILALTLSVLLLLAALPLGLAASAEDAKDPAQTAAETLHALGLFRGTGSDENGNPFFDLDRTATRHEAVTMLVRLLGKETEAVGANPGHNPVWNTPFTDVPHWAQPYVGYAYENKLAVGTSGTTFGGGQLVSATQYLTFILRALGYESGTDFQWDKAWELANKLGVTNGEYDNAAAFTRGDMAIVSWKALSTKVKDSDETLGAAIGVITPPAPEPTPEPTPGVEPTPTPDPSTEPTENKIQQLADYIAASEDAPIDSEGNKYIYDVTYGGGGYYDITYRKDDNKLVFSHSHEDEPGHLTDSVSFEYDLTPGFTLELVKFLEYPEDSSAAPVQTDCHIDFANFSWTTMEPVTFTKVGGDGAELTEEEIDGFKNALGATFFGLEGLVNQAGLTYEDIGIPNCS